MLNSSSPHRKFPHVSQLLDAKISSRRKEMKLSQSALAERTGLTRNCIQQIECHEHLPQPSTIFDLLDALGFSDEESRAFWAELRIAYFEDRALQKAQDKEVGVK